MTEMCPRWDDVLQRIKKEIVPGTKIPKTDGTCRQVTKVKGERIFMQVGRETSQEKYTTIPMIYFLYQRLMAGERVDGAQLTREFEEEVRQGPCVFSMTGGILVRLGLATCEKADGRHVYKRQSLNREPPRVRYRKL